MTSLETIITCPLGSQCEEIKNDKNGIPKIHKCAWYIKLAGLNPGTGETIDEFGCAMAWTPILLIENSSSQQSTTAAVESFRNEMAEANEFSKKVILLSHKNRQELIE